MSMDKVETARLTKANSEWVAARLSADHSTQIWSSSTERGWSCSCGKGGSCSTQGRATSARDKHLTAERGHLERGLRANGLDPSYPSGPTP